MRKLVFKTLLSLFCATALAWGSGLLFFAWTIAQNRPEALQEKTDAIVVLTGGGGRVATGLRLLAAGSARELFISGVNPKVTIAEIRAMWRGPEILPECCITLGYRAGNTEGNADETEGWLHDRKFSSIRLVTASYHMARSLLLFRHAMPDVKILLYPVHTEEYPAWSKPFWAISLREYNKTLATVARIVFFPDTPLESLLPR